MGPIGDQRAACENGSRTVDASCGSKGATRLSSVGLAEEAAALDAARIDYEIVPGITAALAAGSYAGIWITQRDNASAVAFVTGHEGDSEHAPPLDYAALAAFPGTLVFYMGVTTVREWTAALIAAGKSADTPAAIVRRCSWPDQSTIRCTLGTLVEQIESARAAAAGDGDFGGRDRSGGG